MHESSLLSQTNSTLVSAYAPLTTEHPCLTGVIVRKLCLLLSGCLSSYHLSLLVRLFCVSELSVSLYCLVQFPIQPFISFITSDKSIPLSFNIHLEFDHSPFTSTLVTTIFSFQISLPTPQIHSLHDCQESSYSYLVKPSPILIKIMQRLHI